MCHQMLRPYDFIPALRRQSLQSPPTLLLTQNPNCVSFGGHISSGVWTTRFGCSLRPFIRYLQNSLLYLPRPTPYTFDICHRPFDRI